MGPKVIYRISEKAITLAWEEKIDLDLHRRIMQVDSLIKADPFAGWVENVPAYHTLTIFYDPVTIHQQLSATEAFPYVERCIKNYLERPIGEGVNETREIKVPVCYDPSFGFDLPELSVILGMRVEEIIHLHCSQVYHVFMLGFLPGFPYMGILPEALTVPRKQTPLLRVPSGTVAIAGQQTGIYPVDSPGGWYAIGRTPLKMFAQGKSYFEPGDMVSFYPVGKEEFNQLKNT